MSLLIGGHDNPYAVATLNPNASIMTKVVEKACVMEFAFVDAGR